MRPPADWIGRLLKKRMSLRGGPKGPPVFVAPDASAAYPRETLHLACSRCGYRLRGIASESRCPECGQEVAETLAANERYRKRLFRAAWRLRGAPLSRTDEAWLSAVARAVFGLAAVQVGLVLWDLHRRSLGWTAKSPDALLVALAAGYAWALWRLTIPERVAGGAVVRKHRATREVLRVLCFGPPIAAALAQVSELVDFRSHELFARVALVPAAAVPLVAFHQFDNLSCLAARARDRWAVVLFRVARFGAPAWLAVSGVLALGAGGGVPDVAAAAVSALYAYGGLGLACYGVVCVMTLRVARKFQLAARIDGSRML
jgi:hypothetical protein